MSNWIKKNPQRAEVSDFKYANTERGFIVQYISNLYKPSRIKYRKKVWMPEITKEQMWAELYLHIQYMKEIHPRSNGRLCRYCHEPWTYLTRKKQRGPKVSNKRGTQHSTNFAIDRFDSKLTYVPGNIIFCCSECNDRKHDSRLSDWKNFLRVANER